MPDIWQSKPKTVSEGRPFDKYRTVVLTSLHVHLPQLPLKMRATPTGMGSPGVKLLGSG